MRTPGPHPAELSSRRGGRAPSAPRLPSGQERLEALEGELDA
ncbi:MAG: hypothetical protein ACLRWQ_09385 [Flavonifractor plautii]